jgi:hypothetical protein
MIPGSSIYEEEYEDLEDVDNDEEEYELCLCQIL